MPRKVGHRARQLSAAETLPDGAEGWDEKSFLQGGSGQHITVSATGTIAEVEQVESAGLLQGSPR